MAFKKLRRFARKAGKRIYGAAKARYGVPGGMAKLVSDVRALQLSVNSERKYWDRTSIIPDDLIDGSPIRLLPWDGLDVGAQENERNGDQIKALYTNVRLHIETTSSGLSATAASFVRVMAIMDTDSRYDAPILGQTLMTYVLAETATAQLAIISPYKTQQNNGVGTVGKRFKIMRDFKFQIDNVKSKSRIVNLSINHAKGAKKGQIVRYESGTVDYPNARLYILVITDNTTVSTIPMTHYTRVQYVDN